MQIDMTAVWMMSERKFTHEICSRETKRCCDTEGIINAAHVSELAETGAAFVIGYSSIEMLCSARSFFRRSTSEFN